ncbi:hypothetical protein C1701_14710 [Actinoalloteichus sp. AHMU CJ021]|uniref:Uncharacterized protein n=1 Tax=Actinoalloteichus caeruleus DSM 43889 TaxID=1120930 RepID=A0ABT1JN79_ACTCY|nr:Trm112 family protein [Actinoalloteichus caeruleus]AUS79402.1 hypothetical protein C1701_14710 [Actinoalloteichus sp. AHMU CJ021]MCP2333709.1 hypothetical protein [Actinoalloteichus caeruleus DSM 43889]
MAVDLNPRLLDVLACPCDEHGPLRTGTPSDPDADYLTCTLCARRFPVRDGIPVLLLDEAEGGPDAARGTGTGAPTGGDSASR